MQTKRRHDADLYLFSEYYIDPTTKKQIENPSIPGSIIGSVDRTYAHTKGLWHGCAWVMLFCSTDLDEIYVQQRSDMKIGGGIVGSRLALSAAGHLDTKIKLKERDPFPYTSIAHKGAYLETYQECFHGNNNFPPDLLLVNGHYLRNNEKRNPNNGFTNREHVWFWYGIFEDEGQLNHDPKESMGIKKALLPELYTIALQKNKRRRRKIMTDEFALALIVHRNYIAEKGRRSFNTVLNSNLEKECKRIKRSHATI